MRHFDVELGGKTYSVKPLTRGKASKWRMKAGGLLVQIPSMMDMLSELSPQDLLSNKSVQRVDQEDRQKVVSNVNLTKVIQAAVHRLVSSPDIMFELLCEYSPEIEADKHHIDENAYDDEVVTAFVEVVKVAYPFGRLTSVLNGLKQPTTLRN